MTLDDAFINPDLELQMHQSNIETGPSYDAVQLQRSIDRTDGLLESIKDDTDAIVALEAMREFIKGKEVNRTSAILFNIAIEGYSNLTALNEPKTAFALEGIKEGSDSLNKEQVQLAVENLALSAAELLTRVGKGISDAMIAFGDIVHGFDRNLLNLKKRVAALELRLETLENKEDVVYNYVKPESGFTYLMYAHSGFSQGLVPVMNDINWLLVEHANMVSNSVNKHRQWFNQNKNDLANSKLLDTLEFKRDDYLLPGSNVFNRSVGDKLPAKDCAFYRSKELPGGQSFYTEVRLQNQYGSQAIDAIMDVKYFMDYFEPNSFKVTQKHLYNAASLSLLAWVSLMIANPLPLAMFGISKGKVDEGTKVADIKKVRITPDTVFPTLGKDQLRDALQELRVAITNLEKWNRAVYYDVWKDRTVQEAADLIVKQAKNGEHNAAAVKALKRYSVALISLMSKSYTKVHTYSFHVLNAALSYAEKSANQYR